MIQKFNNNDRRTLKFPAVRPCGGVSPMTLLCSLITLSKNICNYRSQLFATQRKNVREAIRQIGILLIFFEEVRDNCGSVISDSVILSFSELHMTLQKLHFLLEDCTREGGRMWILMKSQFLANQFRVLIRNLATALEVLPLKLIDVGAEVRELVEMVSKQARKTRIKLDPDDEQAAQSVLSILDQFETGIEAELSHFKRVLDYIKIRSWSDCNDEIEFLEEELRLECMEHDEREAPLLSGLIGFMCYCRGVAIKRLDCVNLDQDDARCSFELRTSLNPEDFRCPISLELMTDPVTLSTGQTYDRVSIQKWLKAGNTMCPKTGEKLTTTELVPNFTLQKLIQQFCIDNGISLSKSGTRGKDISRTVAAGSLATEKCWKFLGQFLATKLVNGTDEEKNKAACEVRLLAKSNIFNRSCLIKIGTIPPLLELLSSTDPSTQENAISALLKLSKHSKGKRGIMKNRGLNPVLSVLSKGLKLEAKQIAAATVFYLSSVEENRRLIGEKPEAIPALEELIKNGTTLGKKNAIVALFGLLLYPGNRKRVLEHSTVPLLVNLITSSEREDLVIDSLAVLSTLAESREGTLAILQVSALPSIIRIMNSLNSRSGKEYCVSILLSSSVNNGFDVIGELVKEPSLPGLLYNLLTEGTNHASKKARSLLRMLHKFNETSSSAVMGYAASQEQYIRGW